MTSGKLSYLFKGNSGMYHLFECYKVEPSNYEFPEIPNSPGVYIFAKEIVTPNNLHKESDYKVLYVGKADSLLERPVSPEHPKWTCAVEHGVTHICILQEESSPRKDIERDIYHGHNPECNKISPPH